MNAVIIVPALNEQAVLSKVLGTLPRKIADIDNLEILVVDDGSVDDTSKIARAAGVNVVRHMVNRGLGAAIKTGLAWAKNQNADLAITFDADGQHNPHDIQKLIEPIVKNQADLAIGSRFKVRQNIPADRLILNWLANLFTYLIFGVFSTDSQSGLRAFSRKALDLIDYRADRMEFSTEILVEAKRNDLKVTEVPISAIYTEYSRKKGQSNLNAFPVFVRILLKFLR